MVDDEATSYVYIPAGTLSDINIERYSQVKMKAKDAKLIKELGDKVTSMGFLVSSLSETIDEANKVFLAIQIILGGFGVVALFVAAIGMANTMTVTLLEWTNEIGIMKAIGASRFDIIYMFLTESVIMGFLGGVCGIGINYAVSYFLNFGINILARNLGGQEVSLFYTPLWFAVFIVLFSTFVGFIAGLFPSRRGADMDSLEALRYK